MLWHEPDEHPTYSQVVELDLNDVEPSLAGPRRPQDRVPLASAKESFIEALDTFGVAYANGSPDKALADTFPASDPTTEQQPGGEPEPVAGRDAGARRDDRAQVGAGARRGLHARARLGRDRGDHVVHEHVESLGDDRRGTAREEGGREGPAAQAVGQVVARARIEGRDRLLPARGPRAVPRRARLQPRRLRLHDVHRQLRPAARRDRRSRRPRATSSCAPCCPATATSRRASTPT